MPASLEDAPEPRASTSRRCAKKEPESWRPIARLERQHERAPFEAIDALERALHVPRPPDRGTPLGIGGRLVEILEAPVRPAVIALSALAHAGRVLARNTTEL